MSKPIKFFDEKKSWSLMKDRILGWYLVPYITKVKKFGRTTVIVDGFAGCGIYRDGTEGSPVIISKVLQERVNAISAKVIGIFIEKDPKCFNELKENLKTYENKGLAIPRLGDFKQLTPEIIQRASKSPMFFYIDPFGIKGLEFNHLEKIFQKVNISSTEVLVNFNYKAFLREAEAYPKLAEAVYGRRLLLEDFGQH